MATETHTPTSALEALAAVLTTVTGLASAHYPPPVDVESIVEPSALIRWSGFRVDPSDETRWLIQAEVALVVSIADDETVDVGLLDPLVMPCVELFHPDNPAAFYLETTDGGTTRTASHCQLLPDARPEVIAGWYAWVIPVDIKLRRS